MLRVNRANVVIPTVLDPSSENSRGLIETQQCINHYMNNPQEAFEFLVYQDPEVRTALVRLFHGKCAYCESPVLSVDNIEVEHYRPKGKIRLGKQWSENGYYWLAASWDNLLASCTFCNQRRKHELEEGETVTTGKWSYFPLRDESKRVTSPQGDLHDEDPLLVNPCEDDPFEHFCFQLDGSVTGRTEKGEISIKIYGLFRPWLKRRRHEVAENIEFLMCLVYEKLDYLKECTSDTERTRLLSDVDRLCARLRNYTLDDKSYAGMASQLVKTFFSNIVGDLETVQA